MKHGVIEERFINNKKKEKKGLIAFINGGDPTLKITKKIIKIYDSNNVDVVEVGVPFPNSFTDGELMLRSHDRALKNGIELEDILIMLKDLKKECSIPIVLLTEYSHTVKPRGLREFIVLCKDSLIDGILLHCLPPILLRQYKELASSFDLDTIFSLFPNTKENIRKEIYTIANGYLYLVSNYGKTGKNAISENTISFLKKIRNETDLPLALGFGVKSRADLNLIYNTGVDAGIMGSAFVEIVEKNLTDPSEMYREIDLFLSNLTN